MLQPGLPHWLLVEDQFLWWHWGEAQSQYALLVVGASPLFLKACCPLAVNTSPPTHLMPGLWMVLVISAGGLAGEVAGVGSRTLLADVASLGEGWEGVW